MDSIYALDESLLDDVDAEEVSDEEEGSDHLVGYRFSFNFVSSSSLQLVKNMFFKRMMEPALERLKTGGYVDSWQFEKKKSSVLYDTVLDRFADRLYRMSAKKKYKNTMTLSFCVFFSGSAFGDDVLGFTAAALFRAFMTSGIYETGRGVRMLMKKLDDEREADEERCVFYEDENWIFYAGTRREGIIDKTLCNRFAGTFVHYAARTGMVKPVDDGGSRFVILEFGYQFGKMCMLDAAGNVIASYDASVKVFETGKFLDNGLLRVKFDDHMYNFMRMDGTLISDKMFGFCDDTFSDGYVIVQNQNDDYNFVDCDGNILSPKWFDVASEFIDGIAVVWNVDKGETIIDARGKRVIRNYYDDISFEFDSTKNREASMRRIARVKKDFDGDTKCNYIDRSGKLLLKDWIYGDCEMMENGFAMLRDKDSKTANFMREDGSLVSEEWFDAVRGWPEDGVFAFMEDREWQFMDMESGKPLFGGEKFFDVSEAFSGKDSKKYYKVTKKNKDKDGWPENVFGFISSDGVKCADKMYEYMSYLGNGLFTARHKASEPVTVMRWGGEVVADGIMSCESVTDGYMKVVREQETEDGSDNVYNFMDTDGNLMSKDVWFEYVGTMDNGFVIVSYGDVWDVLTSKGVLLLGKGTVNRIKTVVPDELVIVEKLEENSLLYNMFDAYGKQMLDEWTDFCIKPDKDGVVLAGPASYLDYSGKPVALI